MIEIIREYNLKLVDIVDKVSVLKNRFDIVPPIGDAMLEKLKLGSRIKYQGLVFTLVEIKEDGQWVPYIFRNEKTELKYPALRLLNDLYSGKVKLLECEK